MRTHSFPYKFLTSVLGHFHMDAAVPVNSRQLLENWKIDWGCGK